MPVKKLSIKTKKVKGKPKLIIHKNKPKEEEEDGEEATESTGEVQAEATKAEAPKVNDVPEGYEGHEVIGTVQEQYNASEGPHVDMQELIAVVKSNKPMANVGFGMDRTINLGNYENVKVHVAIHVPSEVDEDEIEGNYLFAKSWVEQKMTQVVKKYTGKDAE